MVEVFAEGCDPSNPLRLQCVGSKYPSIPTHPHVGPGFEAPPHTWTAVAS